MVCEAGVEGGGVVVGVGTEDNMGAKYRGEVGAVAADSCDGGVRSVTIGKRGEAGIEKAAAGLI